MFLSTCTHSDIQRKEKKKLRKNEYLRHIEVYIYMKNYYWFELTRLRSLYRRFGVCFLIANVDFCRRAIGLAGAATGEDEPNAIAADVVFNWLIIRFDADGGVFLKNDWKRWIADGFGLIVAVWIDDDEGGGWRSTGDVVGSAVNLPMTAGESALFDGANGRFLRIDVLFAFSFVSTVGVGRRFSSSP